MKVREHRGGMLESMETCVVIPSTMTDLARHFSYKHITTYKPEDIKVEYQGYDKRNGWHTHIVTINGCAVGYTDEMPVEVIRVNKLKEVDTSSIDEFHFEQLVWKKDHRAFTWLSAHLMMPLKAVYSVKNERLTSVSNDHQPSKKEKRSPTENFSWHGQSLILFLRNGNVLKMTNSEWASITRYLNYGQ